MVAIAPNHYQRLLRAIALATAVSITLTHAPSWAVPFQPRETLARPGNRRGAATRSGGEQCRADNGRRLTALVPRSNNGWTVSEQPTFYWYMPTNSTFKKARFDLYEVVAAEQREIYSTEFPIVGNAGVTNSSYLDKPLPPLAIGKTYRWAIVLVCPDQPSRNIFAEGWVERGQVSSEVAAQLAAAAPEERYKVYAAAGLWYDTLQELAQLRQAQPQEEDFTQEWQELMASEAVQLAEIAAQPFTKP